MLRKCGYLLLQNTRPHSQGKVPTASFIFATGTSLGYTLPENTGTLVIASDISQISELQDDMRDMAAIFSSLPIMSPNVIAAAYGWPIEETEENKAWYIRQGYTKMTDMADFGEIENIGDYGKENNADS